MAKYLVTYHGGSGMPSDPEEARHMLQAFQAWASSVGPALLDPGAPLGAAVTVSEGGVAEGQQGAAIGGYSLLEASGPEEAAELLRSHPFVARGGSLQASEAIPVGM